jgi:iron complex outermembrane receptor protein
VLPSLAASFQVTPEAQVFYSVSKNFKAPGNFDYFNLANGVTIANGVGTAASLVPLSVKQETSVNMDGGLRYKTDFFKGSATLFLTKFKNRIASAYDFANQLSHDYNVGDSTIKGLEVEAGTVPYKGFSGYVSGTYTRSTIDQDMPASATTTYPTKGVQFADTPKGMAAVSLQYAEGPYLVAVSTKYTSRRNLTLTGDQQIAGFTTFDLNAALKLPSDRVFLNPTLRLNISNLGNKKYLQANSGSGSNISINATTPFAPSVYGGAPRFTSLTVQTDF